MLVLHTFYLGLMQRGSLNLLMCRLLLRSFQCVSPYKNYRCQYLCYYGAHECPLPLFQCPPATFPPHPYHNLPHSIPAIHSRARGGPTGQLPGVGRPDPHCHLHPESISRHVPNSLSAFYRLQKEAWQHEMKYHPS